MKRLFFISMVVLFTLSTALAGCQQQPAPPQPAPAPVAAPPPTPAPAVDEPSLSENEICNLVWSQLPYNLHDGYNKAQFSKETIKVIYETNGKWTFTIFGSGRDASLLSPKTYEKTPGKWVEQHSREITTYELKLTGLFFEKTSALEILDIEKFNEQVKTEIISETPFNVKELQLHRWLAGYDGSNFNVEGSVENTGREPLEDVQLEMQYHDKDGNLAIEKRVLMHPETIAVGETVKFQLNIKIEEKFTRYDFRFVSPSGDRIYHFVSEPDVPGKLLVHWTTGTYDGWNFNIEGSVENTGTNPLEDVQVKIFSFDEDDNILRIDRGSVNPVTIAVGERAKFRFMFRTKAKLKTYRYWFVLPAGQPIPFSKEGK